MMYVDDLLINMADWFTNNRKSWKKILFKINKAKAETAKARVYILRLASYISCCPPNNQRMKIVAVA